MTPFLEIGANAGHTSYMLAMSSARKAIALDISADAFVTASRCSTDGITSARRFVSPAMEVNSLFAMAPFASF